MESDEEDIEVAAVSPAAVKTRRSPRRSPASRYNQPIASDSEQMSHQHPRPKPRYQKHQQHQRVTNERRLASKSAAQPPVAAKAAKAKSGHRPKSAPKYTRKISAQEEEEDEEYSSVEEESSEADIPLPSNEDEESSTEQSSFEEDSGEEDDEEEEEDKPEAESVAPASAGEGKKVR